MMPALSPFLVKRRHALLHEAAHAVAKQGQLRILFARAHRESSAGKGRELSISAPVRASRAFIATPVVTASAAALAANAADALNATIPRRSTQ
jgi:hypothetical protein